MTVKAKLQQAGDGTTIPAGFVGEIKTSGISAVTATANSSTSMASLTLEAGEWMLCFCANGYNGTRPSSATSYGGFNLYNSTDAAQIFEIPYIAGWASTATAGDCENFLMSGSYPIMLSDTKTIQFRISSQSGGGSPTAISRAQGFFMAVRIA